MCVCVCVWCMLTCDIPMNRNNNDAGHHGALLKKEAEKFGNSVVLEKGALRASMPRAMKCGHGCGGPVLRVLANIIVNLVEMHCGYHHASGNPRKLSDSSKQPQGSLSPFRLIKRALGCFSANGTKWLLRRRSACWL